MTAQKSAPTRDPVLETDAVTQIMEAVGREAFDHLMYAFRESLTHYRVQLHGAIAAADTVATTRIAHKLKGLCKQFGATEASELAALMEASAPVPADMRGIMIDLDAALRDLDTALAARVKPV